MSSERLRRWLLAVLIAVSFVLTGLTLWPAYLPPPTTGALPSVSEPTELRVFWVGHSLLNHREAGVPLTATSGGNVLEKFRRLAAARELPYDDFDDTLFGASLSLLWRGKAHSYTREEAAAAAQKEVLIRGNFTTLVMTEGIPIHESMEREHTFYYAQAFACAAKRANPDARVYLSEGWLHLQATDPDAHYPPPHHWDWRGAMVEARREWDLVARSSATGGVGAPGVRARLAALLGMDAPCVTPASIYVVPVGSAMVALYDRTHQDHSLQWKGRPLTIGDLFANPYTTWPIDWPTDAALSEAQVAETLHQLPTRHATQDVDDIHPSDLGIYFSSLVHYATLSGQSPVGLPSDVDGLNDETLHSLQELVWQVVRTDPMSGVSSEPDGEQP